MRPSTWRPERIRRIGPLLAGWLALVPASHADAPDFARVRADWRPSEAWLLDRHGVPLQELRLDARGRRTDWTPLAEVSPALVAAVLHAEDRRFLSHAGVDWLAAGKAALTNLYREKPRGASTLTMQLAALLDADLRAREGRRGIAEKWRQMRAAREIERTWSKGQVLEAYLNLLPLRGELIGVDAAARALFDKRPAGLGAAESLLLAALIRAPNAPPKAVAERACALATGLAGAPACAELRRLTLNTLTGRLPILPAADLAPHLARSLDLSPGERRVSSLDAGLQSAVIAALREQLRRLAAHGAQDAAALVVDNASGQVLAYASLSGPDSASPESDAVQAARQAGSSLKPFLYGLALERRLLTAASPLDDRPIALATAGGLYAPRNYDLGYRGRASLRVALAGSLNIPAVNTLQLVGLEPYASRLAELGFAGLTEAADFYGPALALGSLDVRLWELVNAYRALANGGRHAPLTVAPSRGRERDGERVSPVRLFSAEAAWLVGDILADRQARAVTFGLENPLATRYWTAAKTGTSKDMRDNWCVGWSERYTAGVWVGNLDGAPMRGVSGVSGAAPAWAAIMDRLHAGLPSRPPLPPPGLTRVALEATADEPPRREWFLRGTEPRALAWTAARQPAAILAPSDGARYALDPDIPAALQRIRFTARHAPEGASWRLDDQPQATDDWPPTPGRHILRLVDADGIELDRVAFEVR